MPAHANFSRASVAHLDAGFQMASSQPRYESGKFAGTKALRIEEAVTNECTAAQSELKSGWTLAGNATSKVTSSFDATNGGWTVTINTTFIAGEEAYIEIAWGTGLFNNVTITFSATGTLLAGSWPSSGVSLRILTNDGSGYGTTATTITANGRTSVSRLVPNPPTDTTRTRIHLTGTTIVSGLSLKFTFAQVEQKSYLTTWQVGGTARAAEVVHVPGRDANGNLFPKTAGTIEMWVKVDTALGTTNQRALLDTRQAAEAYSLNTALFLDIETLLPKLRYGTGASSVTLNGGASITENTWQYIAARWSAAGGALFVNTTKTTIANAPGLVVPPRFQLGSSQVPTAFFDGLIGGLRISKVARSDTELTTNAAGTAQFTRDAETTLLLTFDGTLREPLSNKFLFARKADFIAFAPTATTTATGFDVGNIADEDHPAMSHRTTVTTQTDFTCDMAGGYNLRAIFVGFTNYEAIQIALSWDAVTYTDISGSPAYILLEPRTGYRRMGMVFVGAGRYVRVRAVAQTPDAGVSYLETGLIVLCADLNSLPRNPLSPLEYTAPEQKVLTQEAGGRDEIQAVSEKFQRATLRAVLKPAEIREWFALGLIGQDQMFLLLRNNGKPEETYLWRPIGAPRIAENGITHYVVEQSLQEHV